MGLDRDFDFMYAFKIFNAYIPTQLKTFLRIGQQQPKGMTQQALW